MKNINKMYKGIIIEESLENKNVLDKLKIISTEIDPVTESHKTPWVKQWTMHLVEIEDEQADEIAQELSQSLDPDHVWYCDFCNKTTHYIVFRNKIFKVDRTNQEQYDKAKDYGISLGIPAHQVDFHPGVKRWER